MPKLRVLAALLALSISSVAQADPATRPNARPRRVVFLVDATGSMFQDFDGVREGMRHALAILNDDQQFALIVMQEALKIPNPTSYLPATAANRAAAMDRLAKITPRGGTDPAIAFNEALRLRPDLIDAILDPSDFPNSEKVLRLVRDAEQAKPVKINCTAFISKDAIDGVAFLEGISKISGGFYRLTTSDKFGNHQGFSDPPPAAVPQPATAKPLPAPPPVAKAPVAPGKSKRIVFLLDATGSMMAEFQAAEIGICHAIDSLDEGQPFAVVVMREHPLPPNPTAFLPATAANRETVKHQLMNLLPRGSTDPTTAFNDALRLQPDVIDAVLDPSDYGTGGPKVLNLVRDAEVVKPVKINCVAFREKNDGDTTRFLEGLSKASGGWNKLLQADEFMNGTFFNNVPPKASTQPAPELTPVTVVPAAKVVFLIDGSDSMQVAFPNLVKACDRALDALKPENLAAVIVWQFRAPPPPAGGLLPATPANKERLKAYLGDAEPHGAAPIWTTITKAFALKPDVLYLILNVHDISDPDHLAHLLREDRPANTKLVILEVGGKDERIDAILLDAARSSGGGLNFVSGD